MFELWQVNNICLHKCHVCMLPVLRRMLNEVGLRRMLIKAMFVFQNSLSGKLFSKLSCVCLPLEKLINGKHFPVNENTFRSTENTFPSKKKLVWFFRKVFSLLAVFVFQKVVFRKPLSKLSCVCLSLEKLVNGKYFPVKGKFGLVFRKVFSWKIWAENTFRKLWKI